MIIQLSGPVECDGKTFEVEGNPPVVYVRRFPDPTPADIEDMSPKAVVEYEELAFHRTGRFTTEGVLAHIYQMRAK